MAYFSDLDKKRFSFESRALGVDEDTFAVVNFQGFEAVSKPYEFDILLVSTAAELNLDDILEASAVFKIHRGDSDDVLFNGILADFEQLHEFNNHIFYRAKLVPKLWWLSLTTHNQVFIQQSVSDLVRLALQDSELETSDFDLSGLNESYDVREYVCQYGESHFQFISRWLEREGIYYYFYQDDDGERIVFSDDLTTQDSLEQGAELFYSPASGLESTHLSEIIYSFTCRQKQLPREIILKDYDYENPSLDVKGSAIVDPKGRGESHIYGHYFKTPEEGDRLAQIFAEQMLSEKQCFYGESTVPYMVPGYTFSLLNHYRGDYNQDYFIVEITHKGSQRGCLSPEIIAGLKNHATTQPDDLVTYSNNFKAIPAVTQFRPEKTTERPKISGTLHAKIDAEGDGEYAEMDEFGRYKVRLPFDINDDHLDGRASAFIRMMQPYAGADKGMQFPLTKGTEVMLTFTDGHPDRPLIAGAVNNPETPGPVNADNYSESVIRTAGNNKIRMEDKSGSERMVLESPASNSWIRIGTKNDPITLNGQSGAVVEQNGSWTDPGAIAYDHTTDTRTDLTASSIIGPGGESSWDASVVGLWRFIYTHGADKAIRTVTVVASSSTELVDLIPDTDGVRIRTAGNLWLEAQSRHGDFILGKPTQAPTKGSSDTGPNQIGNLLGFFGASDGYNPTGLLDYSDHGIDEPAWDSDNTTSSTAKTMSYIVDRAHMQVSSLDTVNTQEGNIYDFGGYWNYNLGNSYAEDWVDQRAKLNRKNELLWPSNSGGDPIVGATVFSAFASLVPAIAASAAIHNTSVTGAAGTAVLFGGMVGFFASFGVFAGKTTLTSTNIGDVIAGPNSGDIKTWDYKVGSSFCDPQDGSSGQDLSSAKPNGPMHTNTTWVEKEFGDNYSYHHGNSLDIQVGSTEEHVRGDSYEYRYGGRHEEVKFNGKGIKSVWEKYEKGTKTEVHWDFITGGLKSYEYVDKGHFKFELTLPTIPTLSIAINFSTIDAEVEMSMGTKISAKLATSLEVSAEASAGFYVEMERKLGGKFVLNETKFGFEFEAIGFAAAKEAAAKAELKSVAMEAILTKLGNGTISLENNSVEIEGGALKIDGKGFKFF